MSYEQEYLSLCQRVLDEGEYTEDRTGTGCYSVIGAMMTHDLSEGFPLLTTKKLNFNLIAGELLWFLSGSTTLPTLRKYQCKEKGANTIWSADFNKFKETQDLGKFTKITESLGRVYGYQLRSYFGVDPDYNIVVHDQLKTLITNIKATKEDPSHPMARRLRCSFWNPLDHTAGDKKWCALPACHTDFQCIVRNDKLHLSFNMRSNDVFLGNPYNFASYSLLCHILAKLVGLDAGTVTYFGVDVHIYTNHLEQIKEQLSREKTETPVLVLPEFNSLEELLALTGEDFKLEGYNPHAFIKAPQAS